MKFVADIQDGDTNYVVAVNRDGFIHLERRWIGVDNTLQGDALVLSDHAAGELVIALKSALSVM